MTTHNHTAIATGAAANAVTFNNPLGQLDAAIGKNNYSATAAPTAGDDSGDGYSVGDRWVDVTNDQLYVCLDATLGAAKWLPLGRRTSLSAPAFAVTFGSPAAGNLGDAGSIAEFATWLFSDSATAKVGAGIVYSGPAGSSVVIDVYYAMESATSGAVRSHVSIHPLADGEDATGTGSSNSIDTTVPGTAKQVDVVSYSFTLTISDGDLLKLSIGRVGGHANDTASGDMHFIAVAIRVLQ